jgi:hypothetical protein
MNLYGTLSNSDKTCGFCEHHETYEDEINGEYIDDGCLCHCEQADKYHIDNCFLFSNRPTGDCPYFKERG